MGKGSIKILFAAGIPPFAVIRDAFLKQTGLHLSLVAGLTISSLTSDAEQIISLLQKDVQLFSKSKEEHDAICEASLRNQNYEVAAASRKEFRSKTEDLNQLDYTALRIICFYDLIFYTKDNLIEIHWYIGQYYGVVSLEKTLIDLGGQYIDFDGDATIDYSDKWKQLRKWADYKWYNRPRK